MTKYGRTNASLLTPKRLDPYYYQPRFIEHAKRVREQFNSVMCIGDTFSVKDGTHDSVTTSSKQDINFCVPFLRAQDIGSCYLQEPGAYLSQEDHINKCKRSQIRHGDILLNIMASTGEACFYAETCPETANANRAVGILRAERFNLSDAQKRFLVALLSSEVGSLELTRNLKGSIQQRLNLGDIAECEIPVVNTFAQTYIGDRVRQAEQLRERSRQAEAEIKQFFNLSYWDKNEIGSKKSYRTEVRIFDPSRLDASFYDPGQLLLEERLKGLDAVSLSDVAEQVKVAWDRKYEEFYYLEIEAINLANGSITPRKVKTQDAPSRAQLAAQPWDVLVSTVRPNRKNVAIVPEVDIDIPIVASTGFSVLRFSSKEEAVFYHSWLRSDGATLQLIRWNGGGAYPAIADDIAISTLVPEYSHETVDSYGQRWLVKFVGDELAERLTTAAKLLVEALIEGNITELELQEAQEALQQGDTTLDRQILSRLTRKGIPGRGEKTEEPPLFPDLDALYRVLSDDDDTDEDSDWDSTPELRQQWQTPIQSSRRAAEASTPYSQAATVTLLDEEGD